MWELVSKTAVNPEVEKLLRATQLFELVKNPETAYVYIDDILNGINIEKLKNEAVVVTIEGKEVSLLDLFLSLKDDISSKIIKKD